MGTRLALLLAIVLGVVAAFGVRMWAEQEERERAAKSQDIIIVVARATIPKGQTLTTDLLTRQRVPKYAVVTGMITDQEADIHKGKQVTQTIHKGEPVLKCFLASSYEKGENVAGEDHLGEDRRAVTIRVNAEVAVSYLIRPGDYVDIFGTFDVDAGTAKGRTTAGSAAASPSGRTTRTICLIEAAKVLAVDNRLRDVISSRRGSTQYRTITFELDPVSAGRLINAEEQGRLKLALRSRQSTEKVLEKHAAFRWQDLVKDQADK